MATTSITIQVDSELKEEASRIAEYYGFDLSSVTHAFYLQIIRENRIPLNLRDLEPNEESLEATRESDEKTASDSGVGYTNRHDLLEAAMLEARDIMSGRITAETYDSAAEMFEALGV